MSETDAVCISESVSAALHEGRPVVALETAVVTHGLPREPPLQLPALADLDAAYTWSSDAPLNQQCGLMLDHVVRSAGAVPAMIGVLDGRLHVGMNDDEIARLANDTHAAKASSANLAAIMAGGGNGGTTVSATLIACMRAEPAPIRVFATGGIGGVHRGWTERPDISADLAQLSRSQVCVVCSGGKSILDLPATMEALESLGFGVAGYRTDRMPGFYVEETSIRLPSRVDTTGQVAAWCDARWNVLRQPGGVVVAQPVPRRFALDEAALDSATHQAEVDAARQGIEGGARTPFLLARLAELTNGRSLLANLALLAANAALAAEIARTFAPGLDSPRTPA